NGGRIERADEDVGAVVGEDAVAVGVAEIIRVGAGADQRRGNALEGHVAPVARDLAVEPPIRGGVNGLAASAAQAYTARRAGQAVVDEVVVAFAGRWKARAGVGVVGDEVRRRAREGE